MQPSVSPRWTLPDGVTTVCGGRNVVVTAVPTPPEGDDDSDDDGDDEEPPVAGKVMFMLIMGTGSSGQVIMGQH